MSKVLTTRTQMLLMARDRGETIVCGVQPFHDDEVEYAPRKKGDPRPWKPVGWGEGTVWRFYSRDVYILSRS